VERSDIVKGYEFRKDEYVVIEPEEIKKIEPKTAKTMEILEFVKASEVDPVYFESSYYMMPDEAGRRPYALLTKAHGRERICCHRKAHHAQPRVHSISASA
jgi:DNA end-binding protein Ku